jgi:cytidine deaminase
VTINTGTMKVEKISSSFIVYDDISELSHGDKGLIEAAIEAAGTSYSPYSLFPVGAALLFEDGQFMIGSNQENAAFPSGLCAERVALFAAGAQHKGKRIVAMAIVANPKHFDLSLPVSPCGACRQVISEYESMQGSNIRILLHKKGGSTWVFEGIDPLLPMRFQENQLKK